MLKKCFGIISWFPDEPIHRKQRLERLNHTFKHLINLFGEDIEFLIIAQNWQDYKVPKFVKHKIIHKFNKLGILGARKMLRTKFLESKYDYLIMCDDDIVLNPEVENAPKKYLEELDKHPDGFSFVRYGWSLTFCAISRFIYSKEEMCDVDPELNEGYEDMVFPLLLHYKYPENEFNTSYLFSFHQHEAKFKKDHKSTWMVSGIKYSEIQAKTQRYIENFKNKNFNIKEIKRQINEEWDKRWENPETTYVGKKDTYLYF